ncbi:MAG: hypothetical protein AVDCRST_MAG79-391 [uncultured Thermoleophilia bacterium]|uniref:Uncharacterized protein n=1 Tax=uncultured Thermoleophilia bacterium TaxID=1497501 RepID=A0A6J4TIP9_9ACTN|nr:MAG: hypothetical protein AVDCRST_MAG79-391 [uncultured Thermoleophilia bacterium]
MARIDGPERERGDVSIDDGMRVVDGVVLPPGSGSPNGASQVPAAQGLTDPQHRAEPSAGDARPGA